jgi:hypothetical protein
MTRWHEKPHYQNIVRSIHLNWCCHRDRDAWRRNLDWRRHIDLLARFVARAKSQQQ